jgi:hypothetical protein
MTNSICATQQQWHWAAHHVGVDLLPSVGDPTIPLNDTLSRLGSGAKVPSKIYSDGIAGGMPGWGAVSATHDMIREWASEPAYNILINTRTIRAIDLDIDDQALADQLEQYIFQALGMVLPVRYRENSPRRTLFLKLDPVTYIGKRVIKTPHGKIEGLFNGSQSLWAGRHTSGALMQHRNLENGFPTVSQSMFAQMWDMLRDAFDPKSSPLLIDDEKQGEYLATRRSDSAKDDAVYDFLKEHGHILSYERNGTANIRCPNEAEHSDFNENSTVWFRAGIGGRDQGGFKCLHGHCEHITTPMFLELIGYRDHEINTQFGGETLQPHPSVAVAANIAQIPDDLTSKSALELAAQNCVALGQSLGLQRDNKGGVKKTINNLITMLQIPQIVDAKFDEFKAETYVRLGGKGEYRRITDNLTGMVRIAVEGGTNQTYSHEEVSRQLGLVSEFNKYDSAQNWINALQWDGVARIDRFAQDILKAVPSDYGVALSRYLFCAMAGRILAPGCKADISPVLLSPKQGTGKSSLVASLAPFHEWFGTVDLTDADDDVYRAIKGKVVIELPELRGLFGRDASATKALLSQQVDSWVPKFREQSIEVPRRCVFIGSDNRNRFLSDPSGNRRWAPIQVAKTAEFIDWPTFVEQRDQYWAEAAHILRQSATIVLGVEHMSSKLRSLAGPAIADATILDAWHSSVEFFVDNQRPGTDVSLIAVSTALFGSSLSNMDYSKVNRLRGIMTVLKLEEVRPDVWRTPFKKEFVI